MTAADAKTKIEKAFPGIKLRLVRESLLVENPADLLKLAAWLKESPDFKLDYLSSATGADLLTYLEVIYHLYSIAHKDRSLVLRARTDREKASLPSLVPVFRGAEYQEREVYDMYGIRFEGHPDLRRIFMWDGFEGWPLRKDYLQEDAETLEIADVNWLEKRGIKIPAELRRQAEELNRQGKRAVAQKEGKEAG
ncbi:MAG: hypothetical protein A2Z83_03955 [Omnitrophica bacterium GWA2_52_8]|nr:MAG: hypothetical protein A2Z83_03955 [Omnitrophica bacterium GWA2_52_8]